MEWIFFLKTPKYVPVLLMVWGLCLSSRAQYPDIQFKHYSYAEGLSAPVRSILQDQVGFIWLGTMDGLYRFDGKNFTVFRNIPGDSNSLSNNIINHLSIDPDGNIWAGTNGGLCYFSNRDYRFHHIDLPDTLEPGDRYRIHTLTATIRGHIWFATKSRVHQLDRGKNIITSFQLPYINNLTVSALHPGPSGKIWIGTNLNGIFILDPLTRQLITGSMSSDYARLQNLSITLGPMIDFDKDTLLSGSWYGGLQKIYLEGGTIIHRQFHNLKDQDHKKNIVTGVGPWRSQLWWVGTYGSGLSLFDARKNEFLHTYRFEMNKPHSLSNDYVTEVFVDRGGIVWVGTESGLDKYDEKSNLFQLMRIQGKSDETSVVRLPTTMAEDLYIPDKIWMTVPGIGLLYLNPGSSTIVPFELYGEPGFDEKNIYTIYRDSSGIQWLGTRNGIYCLAESGNRVYQPELPQGHSPRGVHNILKDQTGKWWFATYSNGVYVLDQNANFMTQYTHQPGNKNSLPDNRIFCQLEDHQGNIWIGTQNRGLCKLNPASGKITCYEHRKNDPTSLPDNNIYSLYEGAGHLLWIGTENGLALMNLDKETLKVFSTLDGLASNVIFTITPGQDGHLWLATNNGICDFDTRTFKFKNYFIPIGLPNNRIDGAALVTSGSRLYFSTGSHLIHCDPKQLEIHRQPPPVVVTGIRVYNEPIQIYKNNSQVEPIRLNHRQNMVSFEFTAINYNNPESNQYSYRLYGFDRDWMSCGPRQMVSYTNLPTGNYEFVVRHLHHNGNWYEGLPVSVYIAPPFWQQWWFVGLTVISLAFLVYLFFQFRINQLMRLQKVRLNIARDLHDDIGSTLSSIHMVSSMAEQKSSNQAPLFRNIAQASRQALDLMNEIVWSINPNNDSMEMMLIHMRQFTSELLEPVNINFNFTTTGDLNRVIIPLEKRKDFYLIFKEAINNLAKYSNAGLVNIDLSVLSRHLNLTIVDNGLGFDPEQSTNGNGLKNMKSRAEGIQARLVILSGPGKGTRIELALPLVP